MDLCFELAQLIGERLYGAVAVVDEVHGFKYFDERDLLGFVDGSENPEGQVASDAVFIADEDPDFAGGSYVIVRSTCTTLPPGTRCPRRNRKKSSAAQSWRTSKCRTTSSPRTLMSH